jgi:hypothetical protein
VTLEEPLAANHDQFVVYVPRDALEDLWDHHQDHQAHG